MAFGRKKEKAAQDTDTEPVDDDVAQDDDPSDVGGESLEPASLTPAGRRPLDEAEAGDDATMPRLDLGGIRVPVLPETEVRVELNEQQQPVAASVLHAGSAVQVLAFAAPRNDGIWSEVRAEIAESVKADGGEVHETVGPLGPELQAVVRGEAVPGEIAEQRLRFVGFDGPRWFVRGVFSGPAATDPEQAIVLESVLTSVVVVRGDEPMAPRDPLPLRLPHDVVPPEGAVEGAAGDQPAEGPSIDPLTRGPEITETR
jgi:hypothetical protein